MTQNTRSHHTEFYGGSSFRKILIPIIQGHKPDAALTLARLLAGKGYVRLVGFVGIPESKSLSTATSLSRQMRQTLQNIQSEDNRIRACERVRVSYNLWDELVAVIQEEAPDLLLLEWPDEIENFEAVLPKILHETPCEVAIVRGPLEEPPQRVLVPLRSSVYAEQALRFSLALERACKAEVHSLHILNAENAPQEEKLFRGLARVLHNLPEVTQIVKQSDDIANVILSHTNGYDLVVMGLSARLRSTNPLGSIAGHVLTNSKTAVVAIRTARSAPLELDDEHIGQNAISILVDKWFAENTYYADEFADLEYLVDLKEKQGLTISLALPALNEEQTIGQVITTVKTALMDEVPLLDEIILMDSNSTDRTRQIAADLGIPVYIHQEILPQYRPRAGKGEALWKSLYVTRGDIILWIDTDIVNIHPRFVYGLLGPLLLRENTQFVKGFYRRPLKVGDKLQAGGGGRVTELTARPLLNLFYPELSGIVQPLSGEYGGRRSALEQLPFSSGYGVEIGLLIDIFERFGLNAIAQVDLQERIHHHQSLRALSKMSFAIIQTVMRKLEWRYGWDILEEVNRTMKLIRYEPGRLFLEVEEIAEHERPAMVDLPEYHQRLQQETV